MDFHGMKRKDLQTLCKKHGIPGNLKNSEMAIRLASVFEKATKISTEGSVEGDGIKDNLVVGREAKRVRFSPESEVFEFTRSVKKRELKNVRTRSQGPAQDLPQCGIEQRRSKRGVAKGITVAESNENESNTREETVETEKECSWLGVTKAQKVPRRLKHIDRRVTELIALEQFEDKDISKELSGNNQDGFKLEKVARRSTRLTGKSCVGGETSKAGTLVPAKRSKRLVATNNKEGELVKDNVNDVQDDINVEKVPRRSSRFVNDIEVRTNTQDQRRSISLKASAANPFMGGGSSDGRPLCSAKESKEERKTKQSKGSAAVNSQEGELVKNKTKKPLIDCEVQTTEKFRRVKVRDVSKVEKVPRRSKRLGTNVNVPLVDENDKAVKQDDLEVKKPPKQSRQLEKTVSELLVDGQAQKGDKQPKETSVNDREDIKLLRRSKRAALHNMLGQAMSNSPNRCSVIDSERDGSPVDNLKKLNVNDEMQVRVRFTRNYSKNDSFKAAIVVEGNLVNKKTDKTLDSLVKSSKRVTRRMKRDRSAEPGMDIETAFSHLTPENVFDENTQFEQEEVGCANVEARCSSKKSKTMNQECVKDKPQGMIVDSPSSSETKAVESVMITENVLDSTLEKSVDSSHRTNTQELNSELMEGECEEKIQTAIAEKNSQTMDQTLICNSRSEVKEHSSVAKLAKIEAILENSAECWKKIHSSKDDEKSSSEKEVQTPNLHGNFSESNTENSTAEEEMETISVGHFVNLPSEEGGTNVEARGCSKKMKTVDQEFVKDNPQGMAEDSPSISETKATEPVMISENVLDSTPKVSLVRNTQELNSELMEEEREEKQEQDTVLMAETKDKEKASSLSVFLIERSEGSNPEAELFVETTSPPASVQKAVNNPEAKLGVPTGHILVKDIASTIIAEEDIKIKEELLVSNPRFGLKEHSFVAKLAEAEVTANLEKSVECWNEIHSNKDDEKGSLKKEIQAANLYGNFSEYNTENISAEEQVDISKVGCISAGQYVNLETLDEVKDDSLEKSERKISSKSGSKLNALELSGLSSTDFASLSPMEGNVSECFEKDEMKVLSQPVPINKADSNALDESAVSTTPERNLMLMEQLSQNEKIRAADSVTQHNDEAVESHAVVLTTPEQVLLLGDSGLDEAGKEEKHTTTDFPDESDVLNATERYLMLGGSRQNEAINEGESIVVELQHESNIATSPVRQSSVGDFKGDEIERNEENRIVAFPCYSGTCTSPDSHVLLGNLGSDGAENSGGNKSMEFYEEPAVYTSPERREIFGYFEQDKAREGGEKKASLTTRLQRDIPLADYELGEAGWQGINRGDKSCLLTSLERQVLYGDSEQKEAIMPEEKSAAEFNDEYAVPNIPERYPFPEDSELNEAAKSEENKAVESRSDGVIFTSAEEQLLPETDEGMKGDNITAKFHVVSDVLTAAESQSMMGVTEPDETKKKYGENKDVELLGESNISTNLERDLLFRDSKLDGTRKIRDDTTATCEDSSFIFTSSERRQLVGNSEPDNAEKQERKEVEFKDESAFTRHESDMFEAASSSSMSLKLLAFPFHILSKNRLLLGESGQDRFSNGKSGLRQHQSHHASPPKVILEDDSFRENAIADSSGSIASKVSYSHEFNAGQETQEFMPKGLDATPRTLKKSREDSPHADSVNLFESDTEGAETIMESEINVSFSSYVLALPAEGNSEIVDEISSHIEVAGTCSMVYDESCRSADIQNQIHDAVEELAITDNNEVDELIEAKVTKNTQRDYKGNLLFNSSGKTCEDEHLGFDSEVDFKNTCGKSVLEFVEDEATGPIATICEKAISLTPDEFTVHNNMNEEVAADEEMDRRETSPSHEETLNESSENIKEYLNIVDESGKLSEKQVRRKPILSYRTQVKPKRHDMKENVQNSKIVDNLNVTAPRTSKRKPLQDLRKN